MKKIKLISVLGLASALVLSGCGDKKEEHEHSFSDKWTTDSSYHWHKCTGCDEISDKAEHLDEDHNGKCDVCNKTLPNSPMIKSISIEVAKKTLALEETITLTAKVTVQGDASDEVTWSVNNSNGSISSTTGKTTTLKAKKEGKVTVTLTSKFDESKKATAEFTIVDEGFMPELLDEGYKFTRVWPGDQIKAFGGVEIPSTETDEGFYYIESEAVPGVSSSSFQILMVDDDSYYYDLGGKLFDAEYGYFSSDKYGNCFIDPSFKVEVDIAQVALDEEGEETLLCVNVYKTEEIWESSEPTEDTEWEPETAAALAEAGFTLPFIALGKEYDVYVYDDDGTVEISDYCADFKKLDNYGETLVGAGFEKVTEVDEEYGEYTYYVKNVNKYYNEIVFFGFNEYGNTIDVIKELLEVEEFPADVLADFVVTTGSKYVVPEFTGSEEIRFTYDEAYAQTPIGVEKAAFVGVYNVTEDECNAYVLDLIMNHDFVLDEENSFEKEDGVTLAILQKGKLCIAAQIEYGTKLATEEEAEAYFNKTEAELEAMTEEEYTAYFTNYILYALTGELELPDYTVVVGAALVVYGDEAGMEEPGIYIKESKVDLLPGDEYSLEIIHYEIEETLPFEITSSDSTVATVDAAGKVTAVAPGTTTITVSCSGTSDVATIKVSQSIKAATDALNAWIEEQEGTEELELPEVYGNDGITSEADEEWGCYCIYVASSDPEASYNFAYEMYTMGYEIDYTEDGTGFYAATDELDIYIYDTKTGFEVDVYMYEEEAEGATFDFSEISGTSGSMNGFSFTTAKAGGQSDPAYNDNKSELRLYANNTITFTSEEPMTEIFFDANTCGESKATATFVSASTGSVSEVDGGFLWEGNATEVTLTVSGSGQIHINLIDINGGGSGGGGGGGQEEFTSWPAAQIAACLEGGTDVVPPAADGTSFTFEEDEEYYYDCYVDVYGGDILAYLDKLEKAGYTVTDETAKYGCFSAVSPDQTLEIDVYDYVTYFELDIYAREPDAPSIDEFPMSNVQSYLNEMGITTSFPAPTGTSFKDYGGDEYGYEVEVEGDIDAYLSALSAAGFDVDDSWSDYGMYTCTKGDLEIDIYDYDDGSYSVTYGEVWDYGE